MKPLEVSIAVKILALKSVKPQIVEALVEDQLFNSSNNLLKVVNIIIDHFLLMRTKYILWFISVLLVFACNNEKSKTINVVGEEIISISVDSSKELRISEELEVVKIIPLQSDKQLIGGVKHVKRLGDTYFIHTNSRSNDIYRFDTNGGFIGDFGLVGQGPKERGYIQNFTIKDSIVYILDETKKHIAKYSLSGEFISVFKKNVFGLDLITTENYLNVYAGNSYLGNGSTRSKVLHFNYNGELITVNQKVDKDQSEFLNLVQSKSFRIEVSFTLNHFLTSFTKSKKMS